MSGRAVIYSMSLTRKANNKSIFPITRLNNRLIQFRKFSDDKSNSNGPTSDDSSPPVNVATSETEPDTSHPSFLNSMERGEQSRGAMQSLLKSTVIKSDFLLKIQEATRQHKKQLDIIQIQQKITGQVLQSPEYLQQKENAVQSGIVSQSTEKRIYNSRLARSGANVQQRQQRPLSRPNVPQGFGGASSSFGGAGDIGGGGLFSGRRTKGGEDYEEDDGDDDDDGYNRRKKHNVEDEAIPPEVESMLFEYMKGKQNIHAFGYQVSGNDMDDIDQFLAHVYMETRKTSDNTYRSILESPEFKRVELPTPRPLSECLLTTKPVIPANVHDEYAKELGEKSWEVLSKNIYMNEGQKRFISQSIATKTQQIVDFKKSFKERLEIETAEKAALKIDFTNANENIPKTKKTLSFEDDDDDDDYDYSSNRKNTTFTSKKPKEPKISTSDFLYLFSQDLIFKKGFCKGLTYLEEQQRIEMSKAYVRPVGFEQAETDWSIEAVEDEDALFSNDNNDDEEEVEEDINVNENEPAIMIDEEKR